MPKISKEFGFWFLIGCFISMVIMRNENAFLFLMGALIYDAIKRDNEK